MGEAGVSQSVALATAILTGFNLGQAGFGVIETDESHSRQFLPTPPFRAYATPSNQTVKPNTRTAKRSADLANMARSHPVTSFA